MSCYKDLTSYPQRIARSLKDHVNIKMFHKTKPPAGCGMYYPYVFEFAIKAGLIKNGKLVEPLREPPVTELIAAFSKAAILQMTQGMGCH